MSLLTRMSDYTLWADAEIWKIVKELTDEEFCCTPNDNSGSIRDRYIHMAFGHSHWYNRWLGLEHEEIAIDELSREGLFKRLMHFNRLIMDLNHNNSSDAIAISIGTGDITIRQDEMIFNILNHATYHRGQIVALLRALGKEVKPTDYVPYLLDCQSHL